MAPIRTRPIHILEPDGHTTIVPFPSTNPPHTLSSLRDWLRESVPRLQTAKTIRISREEGRGGFRRVDSDNDVRELNHGTGKVVLKVESEAQPPPTPSIAMDSSAPPLERPTLVPLDELNNGTDSSLPPVYEQPSPTRKAAPITDSSAPPSIPSIQMGSVSGSMVPDSSAPGDMSMGTPGRGEAWAGWMAQGGLDSQPTLAPADDFE
ncbi:hypothetical protein M427DRAFT_145361 [Gonapodya prolifera JEL478]|uniref:Uncharacterized protein n=1 Tax=Gonapodya prolifera (strain JEL478) TaxID=1344416 RepID=A0A139AGF1_GONPJ|nr:hypothetical protein M427DRAFT_145361 [Gonapodya prolifera JEL478]|eukprot:KXS15876.1 hypothetical protein M427DRAFT_145361 [Gonapodya prolifera JEL478]